MTVEPHKANETPEVPGKPHRGRHLLLAVVLSLVVGVVGVVCFDKFVLPGDGVANTSKLYDYVYTSGKSENLAFVLNNMPILLRRRWSAKWLGTERPAAVMWAMVAFEHLFTPLLVWSLVSETGMRWQDYCDFQPDQAFVVAAVMALLLAGGIVKLAAWWAVCEHRTRLQLRHRDDDRTQAR